MSSLVWYPGHELLVPDIVRAENCCIYDARGKRYVDLEAGVWCAALGHGNPRVLRTIAEQSARIVHAGFNYLTTRVHRELVNRGYVLGERPGLNVLRLDPALTIDPEDIEGFLTTLENLVTRRRHPASRP